MGRPKRVIFKNFKDYNLLHTEKTRMMSGVEITTLFPIKETKEFFVSIEVWAYCASKFRKKKENFKLKVDIPTITDAKTIKFLEENCWNDWIEKNLDCSDIVESVSLLKKLYPKHKAVYFSELDELIGKYIHGTFGSYDRDGQLKPRSEHNENVIKSCLSKYFRYKAYASDEVTAKRKCWTESKGDEDEKGKRLDEYIDFERDWLFKNNLDAVDTFIDVSKNSVCYPVAFSNGTGMWAVEKYGKPTEFSNSGEIFFVVTEDKIYFNYNRHF